MLVKFIGLMGARLPKFIEEAKRSIPLVSSTQGSVFTKPNIDVQPSTPWRYPVQVPGFQG